MSRDLPLAALPAALENMCILQLSDLHLGVERSVDDVERFLEALRADGIRPDLVALTGDFADDLDQLAPFLRAVEAIRPRLGAWACMGNHEYHVDPERVRRTFEASSVPLLVGEGVLVRGAGAPMWIGGANDPIAMKGDHRAFYRDTMDAALEGAPEGAFRLLLCHRPEGFERARERGAAVTLSGHTHGGQIGWRGASALERPLGRRMWGEYGDDRARLYLTSGFGHWFRFRFGCPTEAPLLWLRRSPRAMLKGT